MDVAVTLFLFVILCDATQFYSEVGGGVGRYLQEKRAFVRDHTSDTHVLLVPGERDEVKRDGRLVTCTIRSCRINSTSRYRILTRLGKAQDYLMELKPDLIESGDPYHLGWQLIHTGQLLRIPVVGFYHSHFPEAHLRTVLKFAGPWVRDVVLAYAQDYIARLYNGFHTTLVPSMFLRGLLETWGVDNARYLHLGVDTGVFRPDGHAGLRREDLGIRPDHQVLLYIGRLAGEKNTKTLLKSFEMLEEKNPGRFAFVVVGDGTHRESVRSLAERAGCFYWEPYCGDSKRLGDFYRMADCFVHPGVHETFGLVALESQACGCPVVGIRGSYMDANIFAGLEHWAERNHPAELAAAVERILKADPRALGRAASDRVLKQFSWRTVFTQQWEIYGELIERRQEISRYGRWFRS
ncbi:MAG: glycosyltransferase [Candidatus Methylacidiphilales bacterium]